ncbi:MAG: hypothetical protein ACLU9T_15935 [Blautia faecis]
MADKIAILDKGKIQQFDEPQVLYESSQKSVCGTFYEEIRL